jgi:glutamate synthase (ferredoxin)
MNDYSFLTEEHDACGVGFLADTKGRRTHDMLTKALHALDCMEHRGACGGDRDTGDGAGILSNIPWELLEAEGIVLPPTARRAVGMVFLPKVEAAEGSQEAISYCTSQCDRVLAEAGFRVVQWRKVPVRPQFLGKQARKTCPDIYQVILESPSDWSEDQMERELFLVRKRMKQSLIERPEWYQAFYVASLSSRTIIYKGLVRSEVLGMFYDDLTNPNYQVSFVVYHRRFSTNTDPRWPLAQPLRILGHNGEINTVIGNRNWMRAREADLSHPYWADRLEELKPVVFPTGSDSASLDNTMELLVHSGRSPLHALMMLVPEAYQNQPELAAHPEIVDFYEYHSALQEPWDGPALIAFSNGKQVGALLDRNGLRPARYMILDDDTVIVSSEAGVVDVPIERVVEKGRLGPGQMLAVDLERGEVLRNWEIKTRVAQEKPYGAWIADHRRSIGSPSYLTDKVFEAPTLLTRQLAFGYTAEDVDVVINPMAAEGKEPTFSMGNDARPAFLSDLPRSLYDYFQQRFAQVTNPPIDPIREGLVMSLEMHLGARSNLLSQTPEAARTIHLKSPVLSENQLEELKQQPNPFGAAVLSMVFTLGDGPDGLASLEKTLDQLCAEAEAQVKAGKSLLILSDRALDANHLAIPPLLAVGAVHHHLIRTGQRMKASLIVDTAACWSTHHFACLLGYGASAVCPYLTYETIRHWYDHPKTQMELSQGKLKLTVTEAQQRYVEAVEAGILKILSKMGISLLSSYSGAQIFEALGLGPALVKRAFDGTPSRMGGLELEDLAREVVTFHQQAYPELKSTKLIQYGLLAYKPDGEYHINNPQMVKALHAAVGLKEDKSGLSEHELYERYLSIVRNRPPTAIRDLFELTSHQAAVLLEEVESVASIVQRFCTGGMSLGALSKEAHEVLAIAMNRMGGKSNSGEGGEDPLRYKPIQDIQPDGTSPHFPGLKGLKPGDRAGSAIRQIASGRFGVTPEYLKSADQLEIKIAQGAKPGEGGQLPGHKVSAYIAALRRSKPGVSLISPPPHHDIYSIEDLAQLIFDLHQINPQAKVSVKLVAETGIGTIAAGVAKANADVIQVSGHDGGTGASPLSSIKHAGAPWEQGLAEVHQSLVLNGLRDRVQLRVDGGLRTGWDVVFAAMLGADEYGFGTIAMVAEGCIMARICHTNNCPVGVTSQKEALRARFPGVPDHVVNFFNYIGQEVRVTLAGLGFKSLDDVLGRMDLLKERAVPLSKVKTLDLSFFMDGAGTSSDRAWIAARNPIAHSHGPVLDDELVADSDIQAAIADHGTVEKTYTLLNTDRAVGARLSGVIAEQYGNDGFGGLIHLTFRGSAGQSFGAFGVKGLRLVLIGEANDYVGKGINGGEIIIRPFEGATYGPSENVIVGNTCLYGATGGTLYAYGRAGERFAVRNSLADAVIEGAGDHCCEYMTGGHVVVLGPTGRNFGAGMTGGLAFVLDESGTFSQKFNADNGKILQRVISPEGQAKLKSLIQAHYRYTDSEKARMILEQWESYVPKFWLVVPPSEAESSFVKEKIRDAQGQVLAPAE